MAPSRTSRRQKTCAAPAETPIEAWKTLPADILLEIVACSDLRTVVRCAATCKHLRRDLLSPPFVGRVRQAAPCILAYLGTDAKKPLTVLHPTTPAASSFCHKHLSRKVGTLLGKYKPVSSRRGLVLLRRLKNQPKSDRCSDLCVYDPMSGAQTFFSDPPGIQMYRSCHNYVMLTAADGIDSSFQLLVFDFHGRVMRVHSASASSCGTWEPTKTMCGIRSDLPRMWAKMHCDPAVLRGGVIHWLTYGGNQILCYDLGQEKIRSVKLPQTNGDVNKLHLATSSDGKLLKLLSIEGFVISVWLQVPASMGGGGWTLEAVIDMEEKLRLVDLGFPPGDPDVPIVFERFGNTRTSDVVLLQIHRQGFSNVIVLDLETRDMHKKKRGSPLLEIDLPSRLLNMKIFS